MKSIPKIGFGCWQLPKENTAELVYNAIKIGYRHIDSAADYGNEKEVGLGIQRALQEGICTRESLWVTSKLWNTYHAPEHVAPALNRTLEDLQLSYLDSYLVHFPIALEYVPFETRYPPEWLHDLTIDPPQMKPARVPLYKTWQALEALHHEGSIRHIGVCNYNSALLHDLMSYTRVKPHTLQIESHPYLTQQKLISLAKQYDLEVTAFSPLGALSYVGLGSASNDESLLKHKMILSIAEQVGCSAAQVLLCWGTQRGNNVIPKTQNPDRMVENLQSLEFTLTDEQMDSIDQLNSHRRFNDPGNFCKIAFDCLHPIFD